MGFSSTGNPRFTAIPGSSQGDYFAHILCMRTLNTFGKLPYNEPACVAVMATQGQ